MIRTLSQSHKAGVMQHSRIARGGAGIARRGFTFIEIMVAIAIIAILSAIIVPRVINRVDDAAVAKARADVQSLVTALNLYKLDNYNYPSTDQGLDALRAKPAGQPEAANWKAGGYVDQLPKDPWGNAYQYLAPGQHGPIDVFTLGRDGRPGGEGPDADIGNWGG